MTEDNKLPQGIRPDHQEHSVAFVGPRVEVGAVMDELEMPNAPNLPQNGKGQSR